jgi:hypothetical protein
MFLCYTTLMTIERPPYPTGIACGSQISTPGLVREGFPTKIDPSFGHLLAVINHLIEPGEMTPAELKTHIAACRTAAGDTTTMAGTYMRFLGERRPQLHTQLRKKLGLEVLLEGRNNVL